MTDSDQDLYLSDVHVEIENFHSASQNKRVTRIQFDLPDHSTDQTSRVDQDGDLVVPRRPCLNIEHEMSTSLDLVGLQLWRASFFLVDYLFNNTELIRDKIVIDLGAGLGLTSLMVSLLAKRVVCTDLLEIINQSKENFAANEGLINELAKNDKPEVGFKAIDWLKDDDFDGSELSEATVLIASDVIYDDCLTDGFLRTVYRLMSGGARTRKVCFVANERRVNFSSKSLLIQDTAYFHFTICLSQLNGFEENGFVFKCKRVDLDLSELKQFVRSYKRNEFLFLWRIDYEPIES
jgi:predicted nicotinamide N-methyase